MKAILLRVFVYSLAFFYGSLVAVYMFFSWLRHPTRNIFKVKERPTPPECLNDASLGEHHYVQLKNVKLHYVEKGDRKKPLMLFVHGFPEFWYSWRHQMKEFSKDYWTVAIDMRGYGDSEKPKNVADYSKTNLVDDLKDLIIALGKEKCILVAHDWGGVVAWSFLMKYPEMTEKYIIMNGPMSLAYRDAVLNDKKQLFLSWYIYFYQLPYLPELWAKSNDMRMFKILRAGNKSSKVTNEDIEAYKYTFGKPGAFTGPINYYRANFVGMVNKDSPRQTRKITVPGLVVWGSKDFFLDIRIVEYTKKYAENLEVEVIEGGNHFVQQDEPEKTNAAMRKYLAS
ncbi:epoxide hydrolase 4-like [Ischnura elegans]|uniref:epoxide hydrolase 4-like n=1 Tax=Ischnura elegans TaxID=197161 RepID=UPI001ED8A152|nr:epoxide hydrolase 4-like [Ischnura elegans]